MFSFRLSELAKILDAQLYGNGNIIITGIASIKNARNGHITFLANKRFNNNLYSCKASALVFTKDKLPFFKGAALVVKEPYLAYAKLAQIMDITPKQNQNIDSSAVIDKSVILGKQVAIGANTIIASDVILSDNVIIGPGSFIGEGTKIGANTRLWANVTVYHKIEIGMNCLIHSGAVIGSDGFGYANDNNGTWIKIPQLGRVIIGNRVEIGSCTTIDRGSLDNTYIGNGVIIDNQCHIAHNVSIGDNTAVAGSVVMGGGLTIGNNCMIGGASVINGHINICDKVTITGMGMVMRSINESGVYSSGIPVQSNKLWRKTTALLLNINKMNKRIKNIEKKLAKK